MKKAIMLIFLVMAFSISFGQKKEVTKKDKVRIYYFTATWCGPCKVFKKARKTDAMKNALANAKITKIDVDNDKRRLSEIYKVKFVPTFLKIDKKGKVLGKIGGKNFHRSVQGDSIMDYDYMAKVMDNFVNTNMYNIQK